MCYTDEWEAYAVVIPAEQHRPLKKGNGKTNHIERFNCTLRQRVSRLVRKSLSFSKSLDNHMGPFGILFTITTPVWPSNSFITTISGLPENLTKFMLFYCQIHIIFWYTEMVNNRYNSQK
jgi:hypothetical protein